MIMIGKKGKIIKGRYAPNGEILVAPDPERKNGTFYIFIWPNDGTKWADSNDDVVYDLWFENFYEVKDQFLRAGVEVEWEAEDFLKKSGKRSDADLQVLGHLGIFEDK